MPASWEFERAGWQDAAAHYEECWTDTNLFVEPLLDAAGVREASRLLDVACGPGYVSEAAASRRARPVGVDLSAAMVAHARVRCPGLTFLEGDAHRLAFNTASFDAVTMNFGLPHLPRPEDAIAEALRVLAPRGRFAFTNWLAEGCVPDEILDDAIATHATPVQLPEPLPIHRFADPEQCVDALTRAGFDGGSVHVDTVAVRWILPREDSLFEAHLRAGVRSAAVLRAQSHSTLAEIRNAIAEGVREYADGDGFALPLAARVVSASTAS